MAFESIPFDKNTHLTAAQKKVMNYILEHYEEAIFLTASKLSRKAGVSEATVVRLAQVLGYYGYPGMQEALRENLQNRLSTVTRMEKTVKHVRGDGDVLMKIMQEDIHNLSQTLQDISVETFQQAVSEIQKARRIFVAGLRGAHAPALVLALYLRFLKKDTRLLAPGIGDVWNNIHGIDPEDLVIGISFPRYTRLTVEILEYASRQGARVGAITDSPLSPLAEYADWVLPVHSHLDSFIESFTAAISIVNALLTAISIQNPDETMKALREREALWKAKDIYVIKSTKAYNT
jgi:DNA-binding MurR/RpiR family transcriptional regulator